VSVGLKIVTDPAELALVAAERFVDLANDAVRRNGRFTVALSGGATPRALYELLAEPTGTFHQRVPWQHTFFFWTGHVPPDDPESNFRMVNEAMLSRVLVPQRNVQRIHAEIKDPHATASEYERQLREFFQLGVSEVPRFDLILLGLGADGHTASIFPDTALVHEKTKLVAAAWVEKLQTYRITLTMPALNNACEVLFLVSGYRRTESH
jgi:6-phosphogluconolactonase